MICEAATMKVCFAVRKDEGLSSPVYDHFGSAPYFVIVETNDNSITATANVHAHHAQGACTPFEVLEGMQIDAVVVRAIGIGAVMRLNTMDVKIYRSSGATVKDNLDLLLAGRLREITLDHACSGGRSGCSYR